MRNLLDLTNAADRAAAGQTDFERLERAVFQRAPSLVAGVPTVIVGPPIEGTPVPNVGVGWLASELWVDALGSLWRCTADGDPGTWSQLDDAIVADATARDAIADQPNGYRALTADDGKRFQWDGAAWNEIGGGNSSTVKIYRALIRQSGTDDPEVDVLENSFPAAIVFTRASTGAFLATLVGAFAEGKTFVLISATDSSQGAILEARRSDDDNIAIGVFSGDGTWTNQDTITAGISIEIMVYP